MNRRERLSRRAERLRDWSQTRRTKAAASFAERDRIADGIPPGQPILVGHHSERRHRRDLARMDQRMRSGIEHEEKATSMESRAANLDAQLERAIFSDDPDAVPKLTEKIADLEAARERIKAVNKLIRTQGWEAAVPQLTDDERTELQTLMQVAPYQKAEQRGFPSYVLSNLSGVINRHKKRLRELTGGHSATDEAVVNAHADTATARAGLTITEEMTRPRRAGKAPRPVWVVRGNLGAWRSMLLNLDGSWYQGAFSFWEDPTESIEAACARAEARVAEGDRDEPS